MKNQLEMSLNPDLANAIQDMRKIGMSDEEILAELQRGGYEGTSIPKLDNVIPSANAEGTKPVTTLEEITFEQRYANKGKVTPANEAANVAMQFEINLRTKK